MFGGARFWFGKIHIIEVPVINSQAHDIIEIDSCVVGKNNSAAFSMVLFHEVL